MQFLNATSIVIAKRGEKAFVVGDCRGRDHERQERSFIGVKIRSRCHVSLGLVVSDVGIRAVDAGEERRCTPNSGAFVAF